MRPVAFVTRTGGTRLGFTKGKIYAIVQIKEQDESSYREIQILNDFGERVLRQQILRNTYKRGTNFVLYHYPEFPQDTKDWTENDWFQYDLKYG